MNWKYIIVHHTVTKPDATVADIRKLHFARGWKDIGYHYLIQRGADGRGYLKAGRPDNKSGAHTLGWNSKAIGLSVIGTFHPGFPQSEHMAEPLYGDLVAALCHLCKKYAIPAARISYHRDHEQTACPGSWFVPLEKLKADVAAKLG